MRKKVTLKYNKHNANIRTRMEEIYYIWDHISKEIARNILIKIYRGEFYEINKISDRRLILHNLICIEIEIDGVTNSAKLWTKELLELLDNEPEYVEFNLEEYTKAVNNYLYTHKGELSKEELIIAYQNYYRVFEKYDYIKGGNEDEIKLYLEKMNAQLNLNLIMGNFNIVLDIFKDVLIHNDNTVCETMINYMIKDIEKINIELHNQVLLLKQNYNNQIKYKIS
jgi:hypothetical protein